MIEKSVSFRGLRIGATNVVWIGGLGDNSRVFLERVESTTETSDLEQKLSIITELMINS